MLLAVIEKSLLPTVIAKGLHQTGRKKKFVASCYRKKGLHQTGRKKCVTSCHRERFVLLGKKVCYQLLQTEDLYLAVRRKGLLLVVIDLLLVVIEQRFVFNY